MSGNLKALKQVAALDAKIFELEARKRQIPELMRRKEENVAKAEQRLGQKEAELKALRVKTELKEREHQGAEEGVVKLRQQINQAKSNKEFQALQHEILSKEADNARLETAVLKEMEQLDRQRAERDVLAAEIKQTETAMAGEKAELDKQLQAAAAEVDRLTKQRAAESSNVSPDIFAKYERLIARRGQTAMVAVVNGACQGCFMNMRPETVAQLKKGTELVTCHSCGRILYLEEDA